jgi:AAA+ ATPase superfamily predicted ATPase
MQLHLKKFDISSIKDDTVIVFIGRRNTGKSFLVKDLLYYHRDIPIGTVISPTESANKFYGNIVPGLFIHDEYSPQLLENVLKRQKMITKKINKEISMYGKCNIDPRAFLLLDDCLYDDCWKKDKAIKYIFMNGRHVKTMLMITMQYPLGVPPTLRTNVDYVFILREPVVSNRKRIYENYAGMFPTFEVFESVMNSCTENYECLVIDNNVKSNKLEDQVFWYKAEKHPDFTIGSKEFWNMHNENCADDEENDGEELFDMASFKKKKNGVSLTVKKTYA